MNQQIRQWHRGPSTANLEAIILGVTPALTRLNWPSGTVATGFDSSPNVIRALWPSQLPKQWEAICCPWQEIPRHRESCHVVVGDGALNVCRYPEGIQTLLATVRQVLHRDGILVLRCYVRPESCESAEQLFSVMRSGVGVSVDQFKFRLYLSTQRSVTRGVSVRDAYEEIANRGVTTRTMIEDFGWSPASVAPFELWPQSTAVYTFPTLQELKALLLDDFQILDVVTPTYPLGEHCPTITCSLRS